jgi:hypothetical protein
MKKTILILAITLMTGITFGQSVFKKGIQVGNNTVVGNNTEVIDSITVKNSMYNLYDGADTLSPYTPYADQVNLNTVAMMKTDTLKYMIDQIISLQLFGSSIKGLTLGMSYMNSTGSVTLADGTVKWTFVYMPYAKSLTGIKYGLAQSGVYTGDGTSTNGISLYKFKTSGGDTQLNADSLELVASSTNDTSEPIFWEDAISTIGVCNFSSATAVLPAGIYCVGLLYNDSGAGTAPALSGASSNGVLGLLDFPGNRRIMANWTGQTGWTTWPTYVQINGTTFATTSTAPLLILY